VGSFAKTRQKNLSRKTARWHGLEPDRRFRTQGMNALLALFVTAGNDPPEHAEALAAFNMPSDAARLALEIISIDGHMC
jgi:hypothetical protein